MRGPQPVTDDSVKVRHVNHYQFSWVAGEPGQRDTFTLQLVLDMTSGAARSCSERRRPAAPEALRARTSGLPARCSVIGNSSPSLGFPLRRLALLLAVLALAASAAASTAAAADPVIMAAGDIACASAGSASPGECSQTYTSNLALAQQANASEGLAALLTLGDNQYPSGSLSDYQKWFGTSWGRPALRSVLRPAPGNHEYETSSAAGYFNYFQSIGVGVGARGQGWYSFDIGAWHLVALNSSNGCGPVSCAAGSAQETWLKADLAATQKPCILAFWHHPLSGTPAEQPIWQDLYAAGVDFVLAGHDHRYRRPTPLSPSGFIDPNGPREAIVGTGGKSGGAYGVLKMTLHDGSADYRFVGTGTSDSGTVTCHGSTPPPPPPLPPPPPPRPVAAFGVTTSELTASFTDTSTGTPTGWTWSFGDGTTLGAEDPTPNPSHTYARPGTYTVRLTASNAGGATSATRGVTVTGLPAVLAPQDPGGLQPASSDGAAGGPAESVATPPQIAVAGLAASLTASRARAVLRRVLRSRLRRWRVTAVTCRSAGPGKATCTFRARRGRRRASGAATLSLLTAGGSVRYRLKARLTGANRRTVVWAGTKENP